MSATTDQILEIIDRDIRDVLRRMAEDASNNSYCLQRIAGSIGLLMTVRAYIDHARFNTIEQCLQALHNEISAAVTQGDAQVGETSTSYRAPRILSG